MRAVSLILSAALLLLIGEGASAETADRSIDEIKTETLARAQTGAYPALGIQPTDAADALGRITTRDPDEWAAAWSAVADGYMAKAKAASDPKEADANFVRAWRLYYSGSGRRRHRRGNRPRICAPSMPISSTPDISIRRSKWCAFCSKAARLSAICGCLRLRRVRCPSCWRFRASTAARRRLPKPMRQPSRKASAFSRSTVPAPDRLRSRQPRPPTGSIRACSITSPRALRSIAGASSFMARAFGAYWAAKLAHTEAKRLAGAVTQSPPIHRTFQPDFFRSRMYTREYLFDYVPASLFVYGLKSADELAAFLPKMSLQAQDWLGKPAAPIFVVGGTKDTQVPIDDLELSSTAAASRAKPGSTRLAGTWAAPRRHGRTR